ncbi:Undecaprenyl-phosphate mannosyltransferase [Rosistilla carotiformis]|uniref:Undecaprenyl-phosphate mannosyltransferase n=1 Tax=Rosistilla carotiformis TaxID=2528017 RepID=A0A518JZD9_9BACT|nr:glycosyltransferase family 2 protein [Rosistilla carotiformis]QDV70919.1 Undecaprenyl-phosphate mannosyltransferase [Rosistilla carotiformis]
MSEFDPASKQTKTPTPMAGGGGQLSLENDGGMAINDPRVWTHEHYRNCCDLLGPAVCRRMGIFPLPEGFLLSVVVPVYNEATTVERAITRLRSTGLPLQIILVNDGSTDGSHEVLDALPASADLTVIHHPANAGKGAAVRTGFVAAQGDCVVVQDADLEYDPNDFRWLLQPLVADEADVVYGTRYGHCDRQVSPWWHQAVNGLITGLCNLAIGLRLSDVETCYKMVRRDIIQELVLDLKENRFGIEIELTAKLAQRKLRFTERPIRYQHRWYDEGKKIGWKDGVSALWCIVRYGLLGRVK